MTTLEVFAARSTAADYWQTRIRRIVSGLAPEADDLVLYSCDTRDCAHTALVRGAQAAGQYPAEYPAGFYTRFVPGKPALVYDNTARWMALCSVTADGRLATVDDVAVWS